MDDAIAWKCLHCLQIFDAEVWHCTNCNHHWHLVDRCKNCHQGVRLNDNTARQTGMTVKQYLAKKQQES